MLLARHYPQGVGPFLYIGGGGLDIRYGGNRMLVLVFGVGVFLWYRAGAVSGGVPKEVADWRAFRAAVGACICLVAILLAASCVCSG